MAKRSTLTEKDITQRLYKLGHTFVSHHRDSKTHNMRVVFKCGTCGKEAETNVGNLRSPRCKNCKMINHNFVHKGKGKQHKNTFKQYRHQ